MSELSHSEIAKQAYQIWEREGRPQGRDREHWHTAEREILSAAMAREGHPAGEARGTQRAISPQTGYDRPSQQAAASTGKQTPHPSGAQPAQSQAAQPSGATMQRSASNRGNPAADAATRKEIASRKPRPGSRPADH